MRVPHGSRKKRVHSTQEELKNLGEQMQNTHAMHNAHIGRQQHQPTSYAELSMAPLRTTPREAGWHQLLASLPRRFTAGVLSATWHWG